MVAETDQKVRKPICARMKTSLNIRADLEHFVRSSPGIIRIEPFPNKHKLSLVIVFSKSCSQGANIMTLPEIYSEELLNFD